MHNCMYKRSNSNTFCNYIYDLLKSYGQSRKCKKQILPEYIFYSIYNYDTVTKDKSLF